MRHLNEPKDKPCLMNGSFNSLQLNIKQCLNLISLGMMNFVSLLFYTFNNLAPNFSREQKVKMCLMSIILRKFDAERANFELKWGGEKLQCWIVGPETRERY